MKGAMVHSRRNLESTVLAVILALAACSSTDGQATGTTATVLAATVAPTTVVVNTTTSTIPGVFADPVALAHELSVVEAGIRRLGASAAVLDELGRRQQLAYRALARHPEWEADLLTLVDPVASGPLTYHLAARKASVEHAAGKPPVDSPAVLPAWTIVEPLPVSELRGYYDRAAAATGVRWQYLAAIHFQETRMGRVVGVSSAGAVGPMQFLPKVWAACCAGDPLSARDAIMGAAKFLGQHGAPADMRKALNAYNPNSGYVGAVTAYAQNMIADEAAYLGYHGWQVFYGTSAGTVRLPAGYESATEIDAIEYVRHHPDDLLPAT
ncbi:MAG: lytic transglycosylase domain-containing protein [Actinomycetota bacterium]